MTSTEEVKAGRRSVPITHADRVVFPKAGVTKLDLARHYAAVAPAMVPHVRDRPIAVQSFPQGIEGKGFFVKNAARHFPDWIATATVPKREGGELRQVLANDAATLVYLAGQNAITPHIWTARADRLEQPDRIVFDLDPATKRFAEVRAAARALGDLLRDLGFEPFAMTTGSRGLHVVVALRRRADYAEVTRSRARWAPRSSRPARRSSPPSSASPSAASASSSTSIATPTRSTPSRPTPCAPCRRRRSPRRCTGTS